MDSYNCCCQDQKRFKKIISLLFILKTVAEKSRLKILCLLSNKEHCVCEMMQHLDLSQSLISHHLADLKKAGLIVDNKKSQRVYYRLTPLGAKVMSLIEEMK